MQLIVLKNVIICISNTVSTKSADEILFKIVLSKFPIIDTEFHYNNMENSKEVFEDVINNCEVLLSSLGKAKGKKK